MYKAEQHNRLLTLSMFFFTLLLVFLPFPAHALGVSPAKLSFDQVLPGGYAETSVLLSNPKEIPVTVTTRFDGVGSSWFAAAPENATIPPGGSLSVVISVAPPADVEPRTYKAGLVLSSVPETGSVSGNLLALTLHTPIALAVVGNARASCIVGGFSVPDYARGMPLRGTYTVKDVGNTRVVPAGNVTIVSVATGEPVYVEDVTGDEILPTQTSVQTLVASPSLPEGSYRASLSLTSCGVAETSFSVLAPGTSDAGIFTDLKATLPSANASSSASLDSVASSLIPVVAGYRNTGNRSVQVRFSGVAEKDGKVVQILETDPLLVAPGETARLESFFVPSEPGDYTLRGSLLYENTHSEERSVSIVVPEGTAAAAPSGQGMVIATFLLIFFLIVLFLLVLIQRRLKK